MLIVKLDDIDARGNPVSMMIEHAKANADLLEFSLQEMSRKTAYPLVKRWIGFINDLINDNYPFPENA